MGAQVWLPGREPHYSSVRSHDVAAAHTEEIATRIYNYVLGLRGGKKEKRGRLATDVSSGRIYPSRKKPHPTLEPAPWVSGKVHTLRFSGRGFRSWAQTWHRSLGHVEAVSHMPQLEGSTTKIYNYVLGEFGEKKQEKKSHETSSDPMFGEDKRKDPSLSLGTL